MAGAIHSSFIVPHSLFAGRYSLFAGHWSSFAGRWSVAARKLGSHHSHEPSDERNANSDPRSANRDAYVIDQSRPANPHGAREEERAAEIDRRAEGLRVDDHEVVDVDARGLLGHLPHEVLDTGDVVDAVGDGLLAGPPGPAQRRRLGPLLGGQIAPS